MPVLRKRAIVDTKGLYVHSSPPRVLSMSAAHIKHLIRNGDIDKLEQIVLEGQGKKLVGEYSADYKTRMFLKSVPALMSKISQLHDSVNSDRLTELQSILDEEPEKRKRLVMAKDESGVGLLHKAIYYDLKAIYRWLLDKFPQTVAMRDSEGRTPYFYSLLCKDSNTVQKLLVAAGADPSAVDYRQHSTKYYTTHLQELELPSGPKTTTTSRKSTANKESLNFKKSNIRIWIHQRNLANLQQVVWEGHGSRLLVEHSNNPRVRKFLEAVPFIMGFIKDVHCDVQNGDLDSLRNRISPPAPINILTAKDSNGLTPLHKAVGLGKEDIAKYIVREVPHSINVTDNEGRTALHYAAVLKDDGKMFNFLIENGADESTLDNRQKTAAYYKTRASEMDTKLLNVVPDCPRGAREPNGFDWNMLASIASSAPINGLIKKVSESVVNGLKKAQTEENKSEEKPDDGGKEDTETEDVLGSEVGEAEPVVEGQEQSIEGIVNGEHEIESVNNAGQNRPNTEDVEDIRAIIDSGNMEQLAALVLNGEGERLVGQKCDNQELQTFLDNVPVYMSKIRRIHIAAREGSLRDLQAALDRRKFAVARDNVSPNGASPLHVAVAFGRTSVVRYLAGRFPETVHIEDENGRTPLHYAAVLKDNGHYYNLLIHLGADNRIKDKFGRTSDFYLKNQSDFNHRQILTDFGAENEVETILNDREDVPDQSDDNNQVDMPFFATEEGRYLASSLGDPLIKGLTEVANRRPDDPIAYLATYLYNFARSRDGPSGSDQNQEHQNQYRSRRDMGEDGVSNMQMATGGRVPVNIDVVTVEPEENEGRTENNNASRDEHGQSMLHFAAARAHGRNALFQLLLETDINIAYRDELYRTARDISIQANIPANTTEIDKYILHIAKQGDTNKLVKLLLDGYDHITDVVDEDETPIIEVVSKEKQTETMSFLQSILAFEEKRERVHHAIRQGSINDVMSMLADENDTGSGKLLAIGKNSYGRCSLHISVLCQQEEIVDYLANTFIDTLKIGDNLERTALHYAMGVEKMETITRVLIKAGAKRVVKDLKGRQPTYYFLNKSDILRLQEEEETF
ncbi:serine/threonine-protein phosphatase 6 regulatory ankyrin repeat subunit B isoform X3 [Sitophilus oryzae]|uniref:Serine/threonine-protein phosphatase 6 regulatory ankyrin repeat subunit B isoform X3 n=1 Tax=Sitophilus oryzae TaxID=7048 RepID=A0A6J2YDV0_SITOR|nr:serine/threonine-protein phosphatase 6 regulatory ankyrin repeat subunit B isoform X3 [Sitophilus oryzae]